MAIPPDLKKVVILIDGSSFLYRAYYSMRPLHTPQGMPVQAVFGFCRMIKKIIDTFDPHYAALVWDSKGKTTRHEVYPEYKATRQAAPSDLFEQKEYIIRFAEAIGLKQVQQQGIEADDIMYSIARERVKAGDDIILITSDKDMAQVLGEHIMMYDTFKETFITAQSFEKEKGFPVEKLPFYYALVGDTSDNIPGVHGIGKTGATKLVKSFASLEDLYEHLGDIDKRMRIALTQNKENAFLSEQLFLLQYHPSKLSQKDLVFDSANWSQARDLFAELNFRSLLQDIEGRSKKVVDPMTILTAYDLRTVTTTQQLDELLAQIKLHKVCALDTETVGLRALQDSIVGISVCVIVGTASYIPFGHQVVQEQLSRDVVLGALKPLLEDATIVKYVHNIKFDALVLLSAGITLRGAIFDTMIVANLLTPEWQRNGLKSLSEHFFKEPMLSYDDVVKTAKLKNFSYVTLDVATRYAAADAHQTMKLAIILMQQLHEETTLENIYRVIEHPLIAVLIAMEAQGIFMDKDFLQRLGVQVIERLHAIEERIGAAIGAEHAAINLNSPRQIEELLFTTLQLPPQKKSAKGSYSTDQGVLQELAKLHPVPGLIMQYRELAKLKSTYIDALPTFINPATGRIHTTYNQVTVATGRLASSDPNLQNVPIGGFGGEIRAAFKPQEGHLFISADYSQIELRVLAELSGDSALISAFVHGQDIHAQTASRLFDVPLDAVTHEQRQIGKRINFSILYGLTPYGLSKDLDIPFKQAKLYIEKYFAQYPQVSAWMEQTIKETKQHGYVQTLWGRRRYIPSIYEQNRVLYDEACRMAINMRGQGTAAEVMKQGMIMLYDSFAQQSLDAQLLLQIHDELLISVAEKQVNVVEKLVKRVLEGVVAWRVPLQVSIRVGGTWKDVSK